MKIGAQMYTVREFTRDLEGFARTLDRIADIGYTTVQVSGTCPFEADWLREQLRRTGLSCVLTHTPPQAMIDDAAKVAADHDVFGCARVGLGMYPFKEGDRAVYDEFLRVWPPVARALKDAGKYFMYHNHAHEFGRLDGRLILERLIEDVPAELMGVTLDTYWVQVGGGDPAQWLERLAGRIPCIHLKDYAYGAKMAVVGEGNINFDRVFEKAEAGGTQFMLVEQDDCYGEDPFDCLARSYQYLRAAGFQ